MKKDLNNRIAIEERVLVNLVSDSFGISAEELSMKNYSKNNSMARKFYSLIAVRLLLHTQKSVALKFKTSQPYICTMIKSAESIIKENEMMMIKYYNIKDTLKKNLKIQSL